MKKILSCPGFSILKNKNEVILSMAIFQFHMQVIKRNDGKSVVAAAAYRSASKIENQYTGIMEDYTKKKWVMHSEIMLPEHAPKEFQDRGHLWNSVEEAEKDRRARLAREVMIALPNELTPEENLQLVQGFIQDAFVSQGMVADFSIHTPPFTNEQHIPIDQNGQPTKEEKDMIFQNPHAHILLTMRPLDTNGHWQAKTQKEYLCKRQGEAAAFTAEEFIQAKADGWEKQYQYFKGREKVWLTPSEAYLENLVRASTNPRSTPYGRENPKMKYWNSTDAIFSWRKSWEEHVNQALERAGIPERVDCRSYQAQGLDDVAGIHLGPHGAKQTDSQQYQINEDIKKLNQKNQEIRQTLNELEAEIKQKNDQLYESIAERMGWLRGEILSARYDLEDFQTQREYIQRTAQSLQESVSRVTAARENIQERDRQAQKNISTLRKEREGKFPAWSSRPDEIEAAIQAEEEGIRFRQERLGKILNEEGFSDIRDYETKARMLTQMESDLQTLDQKISACEKQIQEHTHRYEKLCSQIPDDVSHLADFRKRRKKWSDIYGQRTSDHIRKRTGKVKTETFDHILHKTDYALNHTLYLAGRAGYLLERLDQSAQRTVSESQRRNY